MKIYDISIPISTNIVIWPGDPRVELRKISAIENGDGVNISQINMGVHTGTHIDAPNHFLEDGGTIRSLPLEKLIGKVLVMEFEEHIKVLTQQSFKSHPEFHELLNCKKVLFKTSNSKFLELAHGDFSETYVGIDKSGAVLLADIGLDLIGVDYLSIASFNETEEPHQILLRKEVILLEGINLRLVSPGYYNLYCLPLPLVESEGAPARAILIDLE